MKSYDFAIFVMVFVVFFPILLYAILTWLVMSVGIFPVAFAILAIAITVSSGWLIGKS